MEKEKLFFFPQRAKKQLVRAEPKASVEGKVPLAEAKGRTCTLTAARRQGSFAPFLWEKVDWDNWGMLQHLRKRYPLKKV